MSSYICKCCGCVNGDMFYDSLKGRTPTKKELAEFKKAKLRFYKNK